MNRGKIPVNKKSLLNKEGFFFSVTEKIIYKSKYFKKKNADQTPTLVPTPEPTVFDIKFCEDLKNENENENKVENDEKI